jgi:hypothetical protein
LVDSLEQAWVFRLTSGVGVRLLLAACVIFPASIVAYAEIARSALERSPLPSVPIIAGVFVLVIVVHEALHGAGFLAFGGRPRFGAGVRGGLPYAFATCPGRRFTMAQFLVIGALPLVVIDAASLAAAVSGTLAGYGMLAFVFNTSGAVGDLWVIGLILQTPAQAVYEDIDGARIAATLPPGVRLGRMPRGLDPRGGESLVASLTAFLLGVVVGFVAFSFAAAEIAAGLNGGGGGRLVIAGLEVASITHSDGHIHGRENLLLMLALALLTGLAAVALQLRVSALLRRRLRPLPAPPVALRAPRGGPR